MAAYQIALLFACSLGAEDVPNPRPQGSWISDVAGVLSPEAKQRIDARLDALERELGPEIAVVTVSGIDRTPKEFATALFNHWGIGKAHADNGLLVLLVLDQRRLEMETGYGLEPVLTDGWLGVMQNDVMVPAFKKGDFAGGLEAGLARVDEKLRSDPEQAREGTRRSGVPVVRRDSSGGNRAQAMVLGGGGLFLVFGVAGIVVLKRRRERRCDKCKIDMRLLDEVEDDKHLDAGEREEETIGSVNYLVYICRECQFSRTVRRSRWFSGYSNCSGCGYKTQQSSSETLVHATYDHGGQVRVTETCVHCGRRHTYTRYTAKLTRSTSSSSSGSSSSSSFGGGRSGGGGAGSSW